MTIIGTKVESNYQLQNDTELILFSFAWVTCIVRNNSGMLSTAWEAAARARPASLVESLGTAGRNYPGPEGENVLSTELLLLELLQSNKCGSGISSRSLKMDYLD